MKNFIKGFMLVMVTAMVTALVLLGLAAVKFGMFNIASHTDHYETTCNGEVISSSNKVVTDSIDFNVSFDKEFNIFSR